MRGTPGILHPHVGQSESIGGGHLRQAYHAARLIDIVTCTIVSPDLAARFRTSWCLTTGHIASFPASATGSLTALAAALAMAGRRRGLLQWCQAAMEHDARSLPADRSPAVDLFCFTSLPSFSHGRCTSRLLATDGRFHAPPPGQARRTPPACCRLQQQQHA